MDEVSPEQSETSQSEESRRYHRFKLVVDSLYYQVITSILSSILQILFPKRCVGCGKVGSYFCPDCIPNIKQADLVCPECERASIGGVTHPLCKRKFGLDGLWSLGVYDKPLKTAIQKLKYRYIQELATVLAAITVEYWARYAPVLLERIKKDQGWILIPVPLHWQRQNWRGFNQSALIAQALATSFGLSYTEALIRTRATKPQVSLSQHSRRKNIKGAFVLADHCPVKNVNCIIIDDVWTTGSTIKECGYILKRAGAKVVWGLTIAR